MKFSVAATAVLALGRSGADAFVAPSRRVRPAPARPSATATAEDPRASVVEAISAAADLAHAAAARSAAAAASLAESEAQVTSLKSRVAAERGRLAAEGLAESKAKVTSLESRVAAEKTRLSAPALVDPVAVVPAAPPQPAVAMAAMAGTVAEAPRNLAASPLARMMANELGLDLAALGIVGSGKNGKIVIDDVRQYQAQLEEANLAP